MKDKIDKKILEFLKRNKEINTTNIWKIDSLKNKIYELRAYSEGKPMGFSFGQSIEDWIKCNGVIITNSKATPKSKESKMSTWTKPQQQYLDNMKNEINKKIDDNHIEVNKRIDNLENNMNQSFNKIFKHLGIE